MASASKTASVYSSLKNFFTACIAPSDPVRCQAHTWSVPINETASFLYTQTMTFPVICKNFSTSHYHKPRVLSREMSRHAKNALVEAFNTSSDQIVLIKICIATLRSTLVFPKLFKYRILLLPSSYIAQVF